MPATWVQILSRDGLYTFGCIPPAPWAFLGWICVLYKKVLRSIYISIIAWPYCFLSLFPVIVWEQIGRLSLPKILYFFYSHWFFLPPIPSCFLIRQVNILYYMYSVWRVSGKPCLDPCCMYEELGQCSEPTIVGSYCTMTVSEAQPIL
jgi:hypothetical protein